VTDCKIAHFKLHLNEKFKKLCSAEILQIVIDFSAALVGQGSALCME